MPASSKSLRLSPAERRERNRQETIDAILAAGRAVMQEHGIASLNLNEVARRVQLRPQSIAEYFPNKAALYDALIDQALAMSREGDEAAYRSHAPGWAQIEAWFANRITLATANPDLYHLGFDDPVPDYIPAERIIELSRGVLARSRQMVADAMAAGVMDPGTPVDEATDILLAIRRGLTAERIGKRRFIAPGSNRFVELLPAVMEMLKTAWAPGRPSIAPEPSATAHEGDAYA